MLELAVNFAQAEKQGRIVLANSYAEAEFLERTLPEKAAEMLAAYIQYHILHNQTKGAPLYESGNLYNSVYIDQVGTNDYMVGVYALDEKGRDYAIVLEYGLGNLKGSYPFFRPALQQFLLDVDNITALLTNSRSPALPPLKDRASPIRRAAAYKGANKRRMKKISRIKGGYYRWHGRREEFRLYLTSKFGGRFGTRRPEAMPMGTKRQAYRLAKGRAASGRPKTISKKRPEGYLRHKRRD